MNMVEKPDINLEVKKETPEETFRRTIEDYSFDLALQIATALRNIQLTKGDCTLKQASERMVDVGTEKVPVSMYGYISFLGNHGSGEMGGIYVYNAVKMLKERYSFNL